MTSNSAAAEIDNEIGRNTVSRVATIEQRTTAQGADETVIAAEPRHHTKKRKGKGSALRRNRQRAWA